MLGLAAAAARVALLAPVAAGRALLRAAGACGSGSRTLTRKTWKAVVADINQAGAVLILQWGLLVLNTAVCLVGE